jgi:HPt (histidine-containing phosphotransfer) domain-containing protein
VLRGDRERCLAAGMDDYISKPIKLEELARVLDQYQVRLDAHASRQAEPPPFDRAAIARLGSEVGGEALVELLNTMIADTARLLEGLQAALANADCAQLRHWAHTLKSNAMMVGAEALVEQFQALEDLAGSGSMFGAAAQVARAQQDYQRLIGTLGTLAEGPMAA